MTNDKTIMAHPFMPGKSYFIRTVTFHLVGEIQKTVGDFLVLKNASWVPNSGRFMNALMTGALEEVEPCGETYVNISSITDAFPWIHKLPKEQK